MSILSASNVRRFGLGRPTPLAVVHGVLRVWSQIRKREADIANLRTLSDHTLKDIGLHRSEITSVVYGRGQDLSRRRRGLWRRIQFI
ncbi:MAG: DUF1127 domain-containing protein [Methyloligellaceae bacterium]